MAKKQSETTQVRDLEDFEDIMDMGKSEVREPDLYPEGPWTIRNIGFSVSDTTDKRSGEEQKCINLRYEGFEAGPEVEPELVEAGGFEGKTLWVKRYITKSPVKAGKDGSLARFLKFVELHGVATVDEDGLSIPLGVLLPALKGQMVSAQIGTREYTNKEDETVKDNTVSSIAALQE